MDDLLNNFFAFMPWLGFLIIVAAAYFASRAGLNRPGLPIGQTFACTQCGHRAKREHMIPVAREGSVLWYCPRHAT